MRRLLLAMHRPFFATSRLFLAISRPRLATSSPRLAISRPRLATHRLFLPMLRPCVVATYCPFLATRRGFVGYRHARGATLRAYVGTSYRCIARPRALLGLQRVF
jgi:hypothetical protein